MPDNVFISSLVTVVIPCYNHGHYLGTAIESVLQQSHPEVEIIVVDDGSSDNTAAVAQSYPGVRYLYQNNQGLSTARNTGIQNSHGDFLVFLDADDWLYPKALATNLQYLQQNKEAAFVSGGYSNYFEDENRTNDCLLEVNENHYYKLLFYNYIGMVAAVMFRKDALHHLFFDTSLKTCEDYDLYLRIARNNLIVHHTNKIAVYRRHSKNMSANKPIMIASMLKVLKQQKPLLRSDAEKKVYKITYDALYKQINLTKEEVSEEELSVFKKDRFSLYKYKSYKILRNYIYAIQPMLKTIKKNIPTFIKRSLSKAGVRKFFIPPVGKVQLGDFSSTKPFSKQYGYDRGGPIDRYYIENFLSKEAERITGNVLEIGDNHYTLTYGGKKVTKSDILHIDASNSAATIIGDISSAPQIQDDTFDCIVLTQTLQFIYDCQAAIATCYRILKPGGTILLTVPGISPLHSDEWKSYWSFSDTAIEKMFENAFGTSSIDIQAYGNVQVATAFLYGLGLPEVSKEILDVYDPHYQLIITVKAVKHAGDQKKD